ncbi:hypothetical protein Salat_0131400 [Sesamum alatum]|uniref:Uncharacterized protein n=1 Tax=Sesamum alatum TaxID=300844 RepID=A0AAE2CXD1_9LAMI|nr:hypothetical protein Salat_0131400 [Sesamum alatum]
MDHYLYANQECSSGCESGWTLYLEHSSNVSPCNQENGRRRSGVFTDAKTLKRDEEEEEEEDDEDLSMVSDASSGPPQYLNEEEGYGGNDVANIGCFYHYPIDGPLMSRNRKKNSRDNRRRKVQHHSNSLLDDTASSPFYDFSNNSFTGTRSLQPSVENVSEYSQGYSTTQFEVRPPYQEHHHYDFFQTSPSANQLQQNQWFEGKRW